MPIAFTPVAPPGGHSDLPGVLPASVALSSASAGRGERKDRLLETILEAQSLLVSARDDASVIESALALIGQAAEVESVQVFQNHPEEGQHVAAERFFWDRDSRLGSFVYAEGEWMSYDELFPGCHEQLRQFRTVQAGLEDLPAERRHFFATQKLTSLMLIPIEAGQQFWGFLGLVQRGQETPRSWYPGDLRALFIAACSIGECIVKIINEQSLKLYREIIQHMQEGLAIIDRSWVYSEQNIYRESLIGYRLSEIQGRSPAFIYGESASAEMRAALENSGMFGGDLQIRHKSGSELLVAVTVAPVKDEYGEAICYLEVLRDITLQKRQEQALIAAKQVAEEASQAKSQFMANMSHEIRTPMNGVLGMGRLLLETPLTDQQRDYAETLHSSGDHLMKIIDDILDFSRIEAGKIELMIQPFRLEGLIEKTADLFSGRAREKTVELSYLVRPELPAVFEGDSTRIGQILQNLISNALKFTSSGGVHVELSLATPEQSRRLQVYKVAHPDSGPTLDIIFAVHDTGIGIPADKLQQIFSPFTQADSSITRQYGGTGLGLAICRLLCEHMGGSIGVESTEGAGSQFYFILPMSPGVGEPLDHLRPGQLTLTGQRLVCLDENPNVRRIAETYARHWGMDTPFAGPQLPSPAKLAEPGPRPCDIILASLRTLASAGFGPDDFQRQMRERRITVIFLLAFGASSNLGSDNGLENPIFLQKPLKTWDLHRRLLETIGGGITTPQTRRLDSARTTNSFSLLPESQPLRILLVEDNPINQKVMLEYLKKLGLTADTANNGQQAVERVTKKTYDLIFMDVHMPVMDGFEAARRIRDHLLGQPQPVIIAVTAQALSNDRERCIAAGMDDYIAKPIKIASLREVVFRQKTGA